MKAYDLQVHRGETVELELLFKNSEGDAIDLTGQTGYAQIRRYPGVELLTASLTCVIEGSAGRVTLGLDAAVTSRIPEGIYSYDFCIRDDGFVTYYLGGSFTVLPSVTLLPDEE